MREIEAVSMGKMIVTNNAMVHEAPFYNSESICQYFDPNEISEQFAEKIKKSNGVNYKNKGIFSPFRFLDLLESFFTR